MDRTTLRGGRVIDPSQGIDGPFDVTIEDDRIASLDAAGHGSAAGRRATSRMSRGSLVTPGLIDLHGHWYEGSPYGLDPDGQPARRRDHRGRCRHGRLLELRRVPPAHDRDRPGPRPRVRPCRGGGPGHDRGRRARGHPLRAAARDGGHRSRAPRRRGRGQGPPRDAAPAGTTSTAALDAALEAAELAGTPLMAHIAEGADVRAALAPPAPRRHRDPRLHGVGPGDPRRRRPDPARGARRTPARRPLRRRPRLRQLLVGDRGTGAGRGPRARCDQHRPPPLLDRAAGRRPADHDVALPRPRAVARRGRHRDDVEPGGDPRPARARDAAPRQPGRCQRPSRSTRRRSSCPTRRGSAGRCPTRLRPVLTIVGGVLHRAADVELRLRPVSRRRPRGRLRASRSDGRSGRSGVGRAGGASGAGCRRPSGRCGGPRRSRPPPSATRSG